MTTKKRLGAGLFRTDKNNNPAAFTTDIAAQAGLRLGIDYVQGDPFLAGSLKGHKTKLLGLKIGHTYYTAKLLGDPVAITIRVIDKIGYKTRVGGNRWTYITMPKFVWNLLTPNEKRDVVGYHYQYEGGTAMRGLFPNYGQL